jgi:putative nucleotidyltransferase with HDIG domain
MSDIAKILEEIDSLRPIPQVAHKIMTTAENPASSAADLAELIYYDQAMTANVLRICNSPYFGLSRTIDSIQQAVTFMGMNQIVDLVLLKLGSDNLKGDQEGYDLRDGELWKYSASSALIAKELAKKKGLKDVHLVFTAALLKDIGKVVLSRYVKECFDEIEKQVTEQRISFREAEKAVLGIDHAELGAMISEKWNFSAKMEEIIRNHHMDSNSTNTDLETAIVYIADTLSMMMGIGVGSDGLAYKFQRSVVEELGFTEKDLQNTIASFGEKFEEFEEMVNAA